MSDQTKLSRRDFIKGAAAGAAVVGTGAILGTTPAQAQTQCPSTVPAKWDYEADVVVVGYGGAGVCAAIAAKDAGASVIVLEKDPVARGGNTGCSSGASRIPEPVKDAATFLKMQAWGTVTDDAVCTATAQAFIDLEGWLTKIGVPIIVSKSQVTSAGSVPGSLLKGNVVSPQFTMLPGNSTKSISFKKPDGAAGRGKDLWLGLHAVATAKGIKPIVGTPGKELIQDPKTKEVLGVRASAGEKDIFIKAARGVVLATGGFENSEEMSVNNLPGSKSNLVTPIGTPYNTGDGIYMATRAGAKLWHMNCGEIYIMACKPASEKLGNAVTTIATATDKAIWVNRYGKRFLNECKSWGHTKRNLAMDDFKYELPATDGEDYVDYPNVPFFWIFDDTLMKAGRLGYPAYDEQGYTYVGGFLAAHMLNRWSMDNQAELAKGWFIKADTIEELAKKIVSKDFFGRTTRMDSAALAKTVSDYNNYCTAGKDPEFGRYPATLKALKTPPYYAMELCAAMLNTNGGPVHNQFAQTLDTDGKPIPRLYSPGELGSIYGFLYQGAGNVPEALSMGRVAGAHAASLKPWGAAT